MVAVEKHATTLPGSKQIPKLAYFERPASTANDPPMKEITGIVATGHLDSQGEMLLPEALYGMADQANSSYIPLLIEHDIARPPVGRMRSAEVVRLDDGILAVVATGEIWESQCDLDSIASDGRKMVIHEPTSQTFEVGYDLTFNDPDGLALVNALQELGSGDSQYEARKSANVVSQLVIASGAFILGSIFVGFLSALGEDIYKALKAQLKSIRKSKDPAGSERASRLIFRFLVKDGDQSIEVNVVLDEATDISIELFFDEGIQQLDAITIEAMELEPRVARITTRQTEHGIELLYLVRDDCKPLQLRQGGGKSG